PPRASARPVDSSCRLRRAAATRTDDGIDALVAASAVGDGSPAGETRSCAEVALHSTLPPSPTASPRELLDRVPEPELAPDRRVDPPRRVGAEPRRELPASSVRRSADLDPVCARRYTSIARAFSMQGGVLAQHFDADERRRTNLSKLFASNINREI